MAMASRNPVDAGIDLAGDFAGGLLPGIGGDLLESATETGLGAAADLLGLGGGGLPSAPTGGGFPSLPGPSLPLPGGGSIGLNAPAIIAWLLNPTNREAAAGILRRAGEALGLMGAGASAHEGSCRAMLDVFREEHPQAYKALSVYACGSRVPVGLNTKEAEGVFLALMLWESGIFQAAEKSGGSCSCR